MVRKDIDHHDPPIFDADEVGMIRWVFDHGYNYGAIEGERGNASFDDDGRLQGLAFEEFMQRLVSGELDGELKDKPWLQDRS